jgi:hypothetical protein
MDSAKRILVPYADARASIRDADLLLFRRRGLISIAGRGDYSHAAKAAWWGDDLFCVEVRELKGGRAVMLSSQVRRYPGRIDLFEVNPGNLCPAYDRDAAARTMRRLAGCDYGYWNLLKAAALHLALVRLLVPADVDDAECDASPPFCSQAVSMADRMGGAVDPVLNLPDRLTEPSDLARSPFYRYRCTLLP